MPVPIVVGDLNVSNSFLVDILLCVSLHTSALVYIPLAGVFVFTSNAGKLSKLLSLSTVGVVGVPSLLNKAISLLGAGVNSVILSTVYTSALYSKQVNSMVIIPSSASFSTVCNTLYSLSFCPYTSVSNSFTISPASTPIVV